MATDTLSSILNTAIPILIIIIFLVAIAKGFGTDRIKEFFSWLGGLFVQGKDKITDTAENNYDIIYR